MSTNKEKAIQTALAKLTDEEKKLLGLVKTEKKPRQKKNYKLKVYYMIGDADGHTDEEVTLSIDNPFVHIVSEALDKLGEIPGHWGIMCDEEHYAGNLKKKRISKLEYDLLCLVTGYSFNEDEAKEFFKKHGFEDTEENLNYLGEFEGVLISETEYSFLVYESHKLK